MVITVILFFLSVVGVRGQTSNKCSLSEASESSLGQYAEKRDFNAGTLLSECWGSGVITANEKTKCLDTIKTNYLKMRVNYQLSWRSIEPRQGEIDWTTFDEAINFARSNDIKMHYFHLIWSNHERYIFSPDWVFPGRTETSCGTRTKAQLEQIMKEHIQGMIRRGGDTVTVWNVVNEAFEEDGTMLNDCYYKIIGPDYIDKAFRFAREATPKGILVLNDFFPGSIFRNKASGFFKYIKAAKDRGVPIDAVGLQNHQLKVGDYAFSSDYTDDLNYFFQKAKDIGVKVFITEMDIYQAGHTQSELSKVYQNITALCLKYDNCVSLASWGLSDKNSWARTPGHANLPDAKPLLFDDNYLRKPAYYGVMAAIKENTTRQCVDIPSSTPTQKPTNVPTDPPSSKCLQCPSTFACYKNDGDYKWFGKGMP
ncbi:MAG: endo-1,4-beta-xylanase, partial [Candidatus Shapirobacteria bacterium]